MFLISQPYTQHLFHLLDEAVIMTLTRNFCTSWSIVFDAFPDLVFIFLDGVNNRLVYIVMTSDHSSYQFPCQTYTKPSLSVRETLLCIYFLIIKLFVSMYITLSIYN